MNLFLVVLHRRCEATGQLLNLQRAVAGLQEKLARPEVAEG